MPADPATFAADGQTALRRLGIMEGSANRDLDAARRDRLPQADRRPGRQPARIRAQTKETRKATLQRIVATASADGAPAPNSPRFPPDLRSPGLPPPQEPRTAAP